MYLTLNLHTHSKKPDTIKFNSSCPFCNKEQLMQENGVLSQRGKMMLVKNKFPTLEDTYQTVLIETDNCNEQLHTYSKEHLHNLIHYLFDEWFSMQRNTNALSTILFANKGSHSSGSISHGHHQIVNLLDINYKERLQDSDFVGEVIEKNENIEYNISTFPKSELYEFNVIVNDLKYLNDMADKIQITADYIMNHLNKKFESYNIFYYEYKGKYIAKITARFVRSAYDVGYGIQFKPSNIEDIKKDIQSLYFLS